MAGVEPKTTCSAPAISLSCNSPEQMIHSMLNSTV